jgi:hypothetical protein
MAEAWDLPGASGKVEMSGGMLSAGKGDEPEFEPALA